MKVLLKGKHLQKSFPLVLWIFPALLHWIRLHIHLGLLRIPFMACRKQDAYGTVPIKRTVAVYHLMQWNHGKAHLEGSSGDFLRSNLLLNVGSAVHRLQDALDSVLLGQICPDERQHKPPCSLITFKGKSFLCLVRASRFNFSVFCPPTT